ncbi:M3 family metallopeptidase [Carboxylicivirga sp. A043]|uniref:M3 family metallopeptidase n=1 Tax=Carboxylicivirga litoralis TaxID=2816963 RepID=UPI0021CB7184|nr:M3 family metallopeptidase [Carboxylicivirga sp. A043]MCU4157607.1 M3 family metallopeptidase [Carboxylicivirga sp. A043]
MTINILQEPFKTPFQTPPFELITEDNYLPAFKELINKAKDEINAIVNNSATPDFNNTIVALEKSGGQLGVISHVFFNLNHAETNEQIQTIAREVSPLLTEYSNDIWLNDKLFLKVKEVYENQDQADLSAEQQQLLNETYKGFVRKGALLEGDARERYRKITTELSKLTLQFGENLLTETNSFQLHVSNEDELKGLPEGVMDAAAALAKSQEKEGWVFTLQFPSYMPFMKYAQNRELRKQMYRAYSKRCNNNNKHDNKLLIQKIVSLRVEKAKLLGYESHAHFVLEEHMALHPDKVNGFLAELLEASIDVARQDVKDVEAFASENGLEGALQRWDYPYYAEQLKAKKYGLDDEATRPYFELKKVEQGVLGLATKLYGLSFKENSSISVYHDEVKTYEVYDEKGTFLSIFYVDYHPRTTKQGGAWMTSFRDQHHDDDEDVRPHISIVCNFTRPTETKPSLLTFNEVQTFLHEFGHALHGMLSQVSYESLAGTSVYRDFVELPSQIMENWATQKEWLKDVGVHYQTGEVIPDELIQKIIDSENYQSGYATVRQLSFGMNDMAWHSLNEAFAGDVVEFEKQSMAATELFPLVDGTAFSTGFAHIFDGGYAAGYYGYKWAEVLDADAFEAFKENGIFDKATAHKFRTEILEKGGTAHPMTLYKNFRGHEPSIEPLLKRSGLKK